MMKSRLIFLFILFLVFLDIGSNAIEIYGDIYSGITYSECNGEYLFSHSVKNESIYSYIGGNFYIHHYDSNFNQFYMDIEFKNNINNITFTSDEKDTEDLDLSLRQCYIVIPRSLRSIFYVGKKNKNLGVANYFSSSENPAIFEWNYIHSPAVHYGLVVDLSQSEELGQIHYVPYVDFQHNRLNLKGFVSIRESRINSGGFNWTYQLDKYQFYGEGLIKKKTGNNVSEPDNIFLKQNEEQYYDIVLGCQYIDDNFSVILEYLYHNNGFNEFEQEGFFNRIQNTDIKQPDRLKKYYQLFSFTKNYFGIALSYSPSSLSDLSMGISTIFSLQPERDFSKYMSYQLSPYLQYAINQNLNLKCSYSYINGGELGEFNKLSEWQRRINLSLNYSF